ncbi:MAG: tetraprenyl-beta-curcumene synthase family protein [Syntrophales bacterium]
MAVPTGFWTMTVRTIREVLPDAHFFLNGWIEKAKQIPDPELRKQALMSIHTKAFHCEGGALYGLLAGEKRNDAVKFIVAYQTISDYLDNLCDRSTSVDPLDFRTLHEAMFHALTPCAPCTNYYRYREEQSDGGYLADLVRTCQSILEKTPAYEKISPSLYELATYYCDLQVFKHVRVEDRVPYLKAWFEVYRPVLPPMSWYEFSACAGSTLGIFCLVSSAQNDYCSGTLVNQIRNAYFPWVQGLHILMDYFVDQEEDLIGGDLNFCSYYENDDRMIERLLLFFRMASQGVSKLPHAGFHKMICHGLPAVYLADRKVTRQKRVKELARKIIRQGGALTAFFHINCLLYRRISKT